MKIKLTCLNWKKTCYEGKNEGGCFRNRKVDFASDYLLMIVRENEFGAFASFLAGKFQRAWPNGPLEFEDLSEEEKVVDLNDVEEVWKIQVV